MVAQRTLALTLQIGGQLSSSASRAFTGAGRLFDGVGRRMDNLEGKQRDLRKELTRVRRAQREAFDPEEVADFRREVERLERELEGTTRQLDTLSRNRQRALGRAGRAAGVAGAGLGLGIAGITAGLGIQRRESERAREIQRASLTSGTGTTEIQRLANFGVASGILDEEGAVERAADIARELRNRLGEAVTDQSGATFDILQRLGLDAATLQRQLADSPLETILQLTDDIQEGLGASAQFGFEEVFGGSEGEIVAGFAAMSEAQRELIRASAERRPVYTPEELERLNAARLATLELTGAFANLTKEVGSALAPAITALTEQITPIISGFANWVKENPRLAKTIGIVAGGILVAVTAIAGITAAVFAFQAVWVAFNILFAATPIGLIILLIVAAVAALVGIGYVLYKNWDSIMAALSKGIQALKDTWDALVIAVAGGLRSTLVPVFEFVTSKINDVLNLLNSLPFVEIDTRLDTAALDNAISGFERGATFGNVGAGVSETQNNINIEVNAPTQEELPEMIGDAVAESLVVRR